MLEARSDEEMQDTNERALEIVTLLLDAPGFLSHMGVTVGRRMYTITAWETPEAAQQVRAMPQHREAVARFFGADVASGGLTGIWTPWRLNGTLVRCDACDKMIAQLPRPAPAARRCHARPPGDDLGEARKEHAQRFSFIGVEGWLGVAAGK